MSGLSASFLSRIITMCQVKQALRNDTHVRCMCLTVSEIHQKYLRKFRSCMKVIDIFRVCRTALI